MGMFAHDDQVQLYKTATKTTTATLGSNEFVTSDDTSGSYTIYLPEYPKEGRRYGVSKKAGTNATYTVVSGNGKLINNNPAVYLYSNSESIECMYNSTDDTWRIV